ncbi:MAG: BrnT family toxin [Candidatus Korobacteraceae bacterium]|jgi:uncharacterized protein
MRRVRTGYISAAGSLRFEWDKVKAEANLRLHGVSFDSARTTFKDVFAVERQDDREDYREPRFVTMGKAENGVILVVVYTERENRIRIISARRATRFEEEDYFRQNS